MLSHSKIRRAFLSFDQKYFGGRMVEEIDVVKFTPIPGDSTCARLGVFRGKREIHIDPKFALNSCSWKQSLLHEMAHHSSNDWGHGRAFHKEISRLFKAGAYRQLL